MITTIISLLLRLSKMLPEGWNYSLLSNVNVSRGTLLRIITSELLFTSINIITGIIVSSTTISITSIIYIYTHKCVCVCMYIYIYREREIERERKRCIHMQNSVSIITRYHHHTLRARRGRGGQPGDYYY